jgi:hypothetical protein
VVYVMGCALSHFADYVVGWVADYVDGHAVDCVVDHVVDCDFMFNLTLCAVVLHITACPELAQHLYALVHAPAAGLEVDAVDIEFVLHPAAARAEQKTPAAQERHRARGLGHVHRVA